MLTYSPNPAQGRLADSDLASATVARQWEKCSNFASRFAFAVAFASYYYFASARCPERQRWWGFGCFPFGSSWVAFPAAACVPYTFAADSSSYYFPL